MANKQSASNEFVRAVLTLIGESRDSAVLGLAPGQLRGKKLRDTLLVEFTNHCAYCGVSITSKNSEIDHLVPMNKDSVGLHMYGNLVIVCKACNESKHSHSLEDFRAKYPERVSTEVVNTLKMRSKKYGSDLDTKPLREFVGELYADISGCVEQKRQEAMSLLPPPSEATKSAALKIQRKSEFDFSELAKKFPLGSRVKAKLDGKIGEVVDYSLEGDIGKRKPYVRFKVEGASKPITRSPNQLETVN